MYPQYPMFDNFLYHGPPESLYRGPPSPRYIMYLNTFYNVHVHYTMFINYIYKLHKYMYIFSSPSSYGLLTIYTILYIALLDYKGDIFLQKCFLSLNYYK